MKTKLFFKAPTAKIITIFNLFAILLVNTLTTSVPNHIEISQLTSFYMIGNTGLNGLNKTILIKSRLNPIAYNSKCVKIFFPTKRKNFQLSGTKTMKTMKHWKQCCEYSVHDGFNLFKKNVRGSLNSSKLVVFFKRPRKLTKVNGLPACSETRNNTYLALLLSTLLLSSSSSILSLSLDGKPWTTNSFTWFQLLLFITCFSTRGCLAAL